MTVERGSIVAGAFVRRGLGRAECQDAVVVGDFICGRPTDRPTGFTVDNAVGVFAVCDGVGGLPGGHAASAAAALLLADHRPSSDRALRASLLDIDRRTTPGGGATTAAGVLLRDAERGCSDYPTVTAFSVGDSRVYVGVDGYAWPVTTDDAAASGGLTQALGAGVHVNPQTIGIPVHRRPVIAAVTDGVHRVVDDDAMRRALAERDPLGALWELTRGAEDDASAVVLDLRALRPSGTPRTETVERPARGRRNGEGVSNGDVRRWWRRG